MASASELDVSPRVSSSRLSSLTGHQVWVWGVGVFQQVFLSVFLTDEKRGSREGMGAFLPACTTVRLLCVGTQVRVIWRLSSLPEQDSGGIECCFLLQHFCGHFGGHPPLRPWTPEESLLMFSFGWVTAAASEAWDPSSARASLAPSTSFCGGGSALQGALSDRIWGSPGAGSLPWVCGSLRRSWAQQSQGRRWPAHPLSVPWSASHCVDFQVCARPVSHVFLLQPTHTELSRLCEMRGRPWQVAFAAKQLFSARCLLESPTSLSLQDAC